MKKTPQGRIDNLLLWMPPKKLYRRSRPRAIYWLRYVAWRARWALSERIETDENVIIRRKGGSLAGTMFPQPCSRQPRRAICNLPGEDTFAAARPLCRSCIRARRGETNDRAAGIDDGLWLTDGLATTGNKPDSRIGEPYHSRFRPSTDVRLDRQLLFP
jgi:hypothetical protein